MSVHVQKTERDAFFLALFVHLEKNADRGRIDIFDLRHVQKKTFGSALPDQSKKLLLRSKRAPAFEQPAQLQNCQVRGRFFDNDLKFLFHCFSAPIDAHTASTVFFVVSSMVMS